MGFDQLGKVFAIYTGAIVVFCTLLGIFIGWLVF